ncbi:methyltransferase domain-containing protein [Specibacter sp. NPDC078709]|uniref:class I SAM-dependent methyltransferase n=1 Tax=Specibacter sp. NPDC078709 TaxID=3154364 RepID=UPI00342AC265
MLQSAHSLIALLKKSLGLELFITGGTLLGLVRDGKLIDSVDDADLAYVSKHENPSDIALGSYEVERLLAGNGFQTVRHSSGHLQVMFGGTAYTDGYYVDIFTYFKIDGWFYGTFHAREKTEDLTVCPLGRLEHNGLELTIPANAGQMLAAIYGPNWLTLDPAFTFVTPESAGRRFYWRLNRYHPFREDWEDYHRGLISADTQTEPSALASWLTSNLEPEAAVLELGCGLGTDALALAGSGHQVLAVDYSRSAIVRAISKNNAAPVTPSGKSRFEVRNVNSIRDMAAVVTSAARLAGPGAPVTVISRNLFDNLHFLGRDNALLDIAHLLNRGGSAYLQMRNPKVGSKPRDRHEPDGENIFDP